MKRCFPAQRLHYTTLLFFTFWSTGSPTFTFHETVNFPQNIGNRALEGPTFYSAGEDGSKHLPCIISVSL